MSYNNLAIAKGTFTAFCPCGWPSCWIAPYVPVPEVGPDFRIALHQPASPAILHFQVFSTLFRRLASVQITIPPAGTVPIAQLQRLVFLWIAPHLPAPRAVLISGSLSISLPHLQSFTFGPSPACSGRFPLFTAPALLPVPFPSPSSSDSSFCGLLPIFPPRGSSGLPVRSPSTCLTCNPSLSGLLHPVPAVRLRARSLPIDLLPKLIILPRHLQPQREGLGNFHGDLFCKPGPFPFEKLIHGRMKQLQPDGKVLPLDGQRLVLPEGPALITAGLEKKI